MDNEDKVFTLDGPFGVAECITPYKRFELYFEPYANEGEYVKPTLVGTYDTEEAALTYAKEITGIDELYLEF